MTQRRYYDDAYVRAFDARVLDITVHRGQPAWVLDQTYFYPTSGGQPFDTGTLSGLPVVDVVADGDAILHVLTAPSATSPTVATRPAMDHAWLNSPVHGLIDWQRRYDHMQQHSGQHLLSQTFYHLFGYETVSVHFGAEESSLDLDVEVLTAAQMQEAEAFANRQVYANLPIRAYVLHESAIDRVPLRRAPKVTGDVRIVEIEAFDYSACGGTHCRRTGELGPIKLVRQARQNRRARISFLCGGRALADYNEKQQLLGEAAALFDNELRQVPTLIANMQAQAKADQNRIRALLDQLLPYESQALRQGAVAAGDHQLVLQVYDDRKIDAVRQLAISVVDSPGQIALLGVVDQGRLTLVFARSADVPLHMGDLLRTTVQQFGGGGGGRADLAQGGGLALETSADAQAILAFARSLIDT